LQLASEILLKGKHPISGDIYELHANGLIRVAATDTEPGGFFKRNGEWVSGEVRFADQHFCQWLSQKGLSAAPTRANPLIGQ
jgi:hypothetical protein